MVYLDNASTTRPCKEAIDAASRCMREHFGNPSSLHRPGIAAEEEITAARKQIAASIKASPDCIYFTSGATESNVSVIRGAWESSRRHKKRAVFSSVEHPSVADAAALIEKQGAEVIYIHPKSNGEFSPDEFAEAVNEDTFLCSVMTVNNETGMILPIKRIFGAVKRKNPDCITHTDAVAAYLKLPLSAADTGADAITVSGHKIHGIKGSGALYIKKGVRISPLLPGGGQERGFRSGTEAVPAIAAFGAAVAAQRTDTAAYFDSRVDIMKYLKDRLKILPYTTVNSPDDASPYILNFSIDRVRSEIMLHYLESREVYISSGSACSSNGAKSKKNRVLSEFGISDKLSDEAIRVSLSRVTAKVEIDRLITGIEAGFAELQKTEARRQRTEDRIQNTEYRIQNKNF